MYIKKFLSILIVCMLLAGVAPSAAAIDCAVYDAYVAPRQISAHPAEDAGPRSFMTAEADEAAGDGVCFHPYVFTVGEDASVSASVRLQPALMAMSERATLLAEAAPDELEGNGTYELPYRIGTRAQLEKFRDLVNNGDAEACAVLINDIDLENTAWTPINDFAGSFEGGGYVISDLKVLTSSAGQYAGLFGSINGGSVRQLGVQGSVQATSDANGYDAYAGGIAGYSSSGHIDKCWFNGTVSASATNNASAYAGGIAGSLSAGDLSNSYSLGEVRAESAHVVAYAGGVAGYIEGEVYACYHKEGDVTAGTDGAAFIGGVAGKGGVDYLPLQCYYLEGTAPSGFDGENMTGMAEPLTAAQFAQTESFCVIDSAKSWDFVDTWRMDETEGRPMLKKGILLYVEIEDSADYGDIILCNLTLSASDANGSVTLTTSNREGNETFTIEIIEGKGTQNITLFCPGNWSVTAEYSGNDRYLPCTTSLQIEVRAPFQNVYSWEDLVDAVKNEGVIILKGNITGVNQTGHIMIPEDKNVTIDLNGYFIDHGEAGPEENGGVFYVSPGANLSIMNSGVTGGIVGGNATVCGGAIYFAGGGNLVLRNVGFFNNTAGYRGGAFFVNNATKTSLNNVTFINNKAGTGGAIYTFSDSDLLIENCNFTDNSAVDFGAIHMLNEDAVINGSTFANNSANYGIIGSALDSAVSPCLITNCIFVGNHAASTINFTSSENKAANSNWFGNTASDYDVAPDVSGINVKDWFFLDVARSIDIQGNYTYGAVLSSYDNDTKIISNIPQSDYPLPDIMLNGVVKGAEINIARLPALLMQDAETDDTGAMLMLSWAGYRNINFTPSLDSTNYTIGFNYPGHPEISENRTYVRSLEVNGGQGVEFNETDELSTVNLTALENQEAVPNAVLANKTVSVAIGDEVSNYMLTGDGVFEMSPGNATPGTHESLITVAGFAPLAVNITMPKYHTPLNVTAPEYVVIGEDVLISAQVPENATGNVTLNIRDEAVYDKTFCPEIDDGVVTASVSGLPVGTYTANITYPGDDNYLENATSISFRVVEKSYTVALSASPAGGGSVTGAGNYTGGTNVTVTAAPNTGYDFVSWKENGAVVSENETYSFTAEADRALTAGFALKTFTVCFLDENGTVLQNGTAAYGETPEYSGEEPTKAEDAQYTYTFSGWTPALGPVTEAVNYTATFNATEKIWCVSVAADPAEGGSVSGAGNYTSGTQVTVTAEPNTGYDFVSWTESGAAVSENASYTFTAEADRALTAGFALKTFTVCFLGENGTVLQNGTAAYGETPEYSGEELTKAEDAQYTYTFSGWTPAIGPVTEAVNYTATFNATEKTAPAPAPSYDYAPPAPKETRFDEVDLSKGSLDNFKRSRTYTDGLFSDVDPKGWYFENVAAAYEFALMEGMGDGTFGVGARLKLSEALALACRMHNIYYGGSGRFDQTKDANWYTVYEDYAVKYGIIRKGEYDLTGDATRAQFAAIISAALPDAALKPINDVKELPDMRADDPRLPAILRLYNAGILTGMDGQGSFRPDASIPREQIAAMATRVADPALRKAFTLS